MISETQFRRDLNEKFSLTGLVHDLSEYGIQFLYEATRLYKDTNKMNRKQMVKSLQEIANKPLTESQQVELFDWFEDYCISQARKFKQQKNKSLFIKSIQAIKNDQARELNENQNRQLSQPISKKVKVNDNQNNEKHYTQSDHEEDPEPISQENTSNQNQTDQLMLLLLLTAVNQQQKTTENQSQVKQNNNLINERCRYFPNCTNKHCQYVHPKIKCKYFPHCKKGNKCIYMHQQCKHGIHCKNPQCSYEHPYKKK